MTTPVTQKGKCGTEGSDNLPKATQLVNQQESFFFFFLTLRVGKVLQNEYIHKGMND